MWKSILSEIYGPSQSSFMLGEKGSSFRLVSSWWNDSPCLEPQLTPNHIGLRKR